jgi:DNA repair protein RadC
MTRKYTTKGFADATLLDSLAPEIRPTEPAFGVEGHRARLRTRFLTGGAEAIAEHELIEMVLFLALPRRDTKPVARALLTKFGTYSNAISAPLNELLAIDGLGEAGATALKIVQAAAQRLAKAEVLYKPVLSNWERLMEYLQAVLGREKTEQFRLLFLDNRNRLLADEPQAKGTIDHTPVYPREVVKRALDLHATAIILVHNHPSGDPSPSQADIAVTKEIKLAANLLSIVLHDHIIVGNGQWLSFRKMGLL